MILPVVGQRIQALIEANGKTFEITGTVIEKSVVSIHDTEPRNRLCVIAENDVTWHRKECQNCYIIDEIPHSPSPGHPERVFHGMLNWTLAHRWN